MIITAACAYYDDDLALVEKCVPSWATVADRVVVCDGRYARYEPEGPTASPPEHRARIAELCDRAGLELLWDSPGRVYAGQVEKRDRLLQLASEGSDWIVNADADHRFTGNREETRAELADLDCQSAECMFQTLKNPTAPIEEVAATDWHSNLAGHSMMIQFFFRANPTLRVERHHWWYSAELSGVRHWVFGGDAKYPQVPSAKLQANFRIDHLCLFRKPRHVLANRAFCEDRSVLVGTIGQEDPVLP